MRRAYSASLRSTTGRSLALGAAAALIGGALVVPPAVATSTVPDPVVHYTFESSDLTTGQVTDVSGHGATGTLVNPSTATIVPGADGSPALHLPGGSPSSNGAYVRLPTSILAGRTDLTVTARVNWDGTGGAWQRIVDLGKDTTRYLFATPTNGTALRTAITTTGGGGEAQNTGYAPLPSGTWKTVTVTLDTTAHRITTYLDGAAVASATTTITAGQLLDSTTTSGGYIGKSMYADPLLAGAVDDFAVYPAALTPDLIAQVTGVTAPTPVQPAQTSFTLRTSVGTAPALPATVRSTFTDGFDRDVPVQWDAVDPAAYAQRGTFTVHGTVAGTAVTATVTAILPGEVNIDLSSNTGAFQGGASGTLYGVYGQGVPTNNLIAGMHLSTVATKAQDGPQHPGADALEVVQPLVDSSNGDVYIYMTDIHRGFPYEWPGSTPAEKLSLYEQKIATQVDQVLTLDPKYQQHVVFVPFNEPEGNMFGTGSWSYNGVSWLTDPTAYFAAWDEVYHLIKGKMPSARIAGPNTSVLFGQDKGFLQHAVAAGTVPDVMAWHELSQPENIRANVATYRSWEQQVFAGTAYAGRQLPINIDEYAFNYHTSVPGQMIQWISAIEDSKVDADIAYWNIDGNLSDSAVQANRGNGQWWLYNAYGSMSGHTVTLDPPFPGANYTLQGVATLDEKKAQARAIIGGASGASYVSFNNVPAAVLGSRVHVTVKEIAWTGQIGDSAQPDTVAELDTDVTNGSVGLDFGGALPALKSSSAYEIVVSPAGSGGPASASRFAWQQSYEAESATYTGSGYSKNGPEGTPSNVANFYTSGSYDVGGLRTGSDGKLDFTVDVPKDGTYDLSAFANSLNTDSLVADQGPTNVFLRVDGAAEQQLYLPLGYKWVVWDHTDTTVKLTAGRHVITLAAQSLDGTQTTKGDAILDRIVLSLPSAPAGSSVYEAELADLGKATPVYGTAAGAGASGAGGVQVPVGDAVTFWVYSAKDDESTLDVGMLDTGTVRVAVNGQDVLMASSGHTTTAVSLSGGVNKVTLTGVSRTSLVDRLTVTPSAGHLAPITYLAEDATLAGTAAVTPLLLADGGAAVTGVGGDPGNGNTLTFSVKAQKAGTYAMRVRYSNPEQSPASHYNPDPIARHADISVNGGAAQRVLFPHTFHQDNFWELTVVVQLDRGTNTVTFSSAELPNMDGTYASQVYPTIPLRSKYAPLIDQITVAPFSKPIDATS